MAIKLLRRKFILGGGASALALSSGARARVLRGTFAPIQTAMDSVLLVYNTASASSIAIKDYYKAHRPGAANVDTLGITTLVATEQMTYASMKTDIKAPILAWLAANPSRPKKYVILSLDIPTRTTAGPSGVPVSVAYGISTARSDASIGTGPNVVSEYGATGLIFWAGDGGQFNVHYSNAAFPNTNFLVTHLCMGNAQAAVQTYIDKLATMYAAMASPNVTISSRNAGLNGSTWYFDDAQNPVVGAQVTSPYTLLTGTDGLPGANAVNNGGLSPPLTSGSNPAVYMGWGVHNGTFGGSWPFNGNLTMTGKANWFITSTVESFNGQLAGGMGDYVKWWNAAALGGSGSSRTPVGFTGHTEEPNVTGCEAESYTRNWFQGFNFAECAHSARATKFFIAVGDPLVAW